MIRGREDIPITASMRRYWPSDRLAKVSRTVLRISDLCTKVHRRIYFASSKHGMETGSSQTYDHYRMLGLLL